MPHPTEVRLSAKPQPAQGGFILIMVLVTVMLLAFVALSIAGLANTTAKVAGSSIRVKSKVHEIDGVMDLAIALLRTDPDNAWSDASTPPVKPCGTAGYFDAIAASYPDSSLNPLYDISCVDKNDGASPPVTERRDLEVLVKQHAASRVFGRARVRIMDTAGVGVPQVGYELFVCDWQIGATLNEPTRTC